MPMYLDFYIVFALFYLMVGVLSFNIYTGLESASTKKQALQAAAFTLFWPAAMLVLGAKSFFNWWASLPDDEPKETDKPQ